MTNRRTTPRRLRTRSRPTVSPTHLTVIATGYDDIDSMEFSPGDLHRDVELVKAGVLYADDIEILSLGHVFLRNFEQFATGPNRNFYELMATASDQVLSRLVGTADKASVRATAGKVLETIDRDGDDSRFDDTIAAFRDSTMAKLRAASEVIRQESGVHGLDQAVQRNLVQFNDRVAPGKDTTVVIDSFTSEIKRHLEDPTRFVLLDAGTAELAQAMIDAGVVKPPKRSISNASEAALGTGFLSRLPAFPTASMEEVIQIRDDLNDPLTRYRGKVGDLRGHLTTEPFDKQIGAEIDGLWRSEIEPALLEIRESMADHRLAKELLTTVGTDMAAFVKGIVPAGLAVYTAHVFDIGTAVTTASAITLAAAPVIAKTAVTRGKALTQSRRHDLYYLYEIDRKLGQ